MSAMERGRGSGSDTPIRSSDREPPADSPCPRPIWYSSEVILPSSSICASSGTSVPCEYSEASSDCQPSKGRYPSRTFERQSPAYVRASSSTFSLPALPAWPLTHTNFTDPGRLEISASIARIKSAFFTGFFCEFFQPFFFQPCTHVVEQLIAYCESVSITNGSEPGCARNASNTAHSSPIWLVPFVAPPASQSPSWWCPGLPPVASS